MLPKTRPSGPTPRHTGSSSFRRMPTFTSEASYWANPPKVVWIRRGNCSTVEIEALLVGHRAELLAFEGTAEESFLALF